MSSVRPLLWSVLASLVWVVPGCQQTDDDEDVDDGDDDDDDDEEGEPELSWSEDLEGGPVSSGLVTAAGIVVVIDDDGGLTAMSASSGSTVWDGSFRLDAPLSWNHYDVVGGGESITWLNLPEDAGMSAFNMEEGNYFPELTAFDGNSGAWDYMALERRPGRYAFAYLGLSYSYAEDCGALTACVLFSGEDPLTTAPASWKGSLLVVSGRRVLRLEATQEERASEVSWSTDVGFDVAHEPLTFDDGFAAVTSTEGDVAVLSADDGEVLWSGQVATDTEGLASVDEEEGLVLVVGDDGLLHAFDVESGDERWTYQAADAVEHGVAVDDGRVYVASFDGTVAALDAEDGDERWTFAVDATLRARPVVSGSRVVVVGDGGEVVGISIP